MPLFSHTTDANTSQNISPALALEDPTLSSDVLPPVIYLNKFFNYSGPFFSCATLACQNSAIGVNQFRILYKGLLHIRMGSGLVVTTLSVMP